MIKTCRISKFFSTHPVNSRCTGVYPGFFLGLKILFSRFLNKKQLFCINIQSIAPISNLLHLIKLIIIFIITNLNV